MPTSISDTPTFREEIAQGVEDMQITYGIDNGQEELPMTPSLPLMS